MSTAKLEAAQNKKRFLDVFPEVVEELLDTLRVESMPEEVVEWYRKVRAVSKSRYLEFVASTPTILIRFYMYLPILEP